MAKVNAVATGRLMSLDRKKGWARMGKQTAATAAPIKAIP